MSQNYIWLFGENLGATSSNNSYYFWKNVVNKRDGIDKYIVLEKNEVNKKAYSTLTKDEKEFVVWKNSIKHFFLYFNADLFFVTLSYKDITPTKLIAYPVSFTIEKPLIYLQHGTLAIKQIGYKGWGYNNNFFRFCYYNKNIKEVFKEKNNFQDYQMYYAEYHPRYKELVKQHLEYQKSKKSESKNILWFLTWREYLEDESLAKPLIDSMRGFLSSEKLAKYLAKTKSTLTVCLHQFFSEDKIAVVKECITTERIKFVHSDKVDVLKELATNDVLITDYSSVGFDFTFLDKPVILYQPDREEYLSTRELYCTLEEIEKASFTSADDVINLIVNESYGVNHFFRDNLPDKIDYNYVLEGKHIDKMYDDFANMQKNKITFVGYNFYGVGGTVFATRALAEALLEKNYMVELLSVRRTCNAENMPYGLQLTSLYNSNSRSITEKFKRRVFRFKGLYGHLKYDCAKRHISPYAGMAMRRKIKTIKSRTLVSTRESLHLFLNDATSKYIKNKVYFFHTAATAVEDLYPTVMDKLKHINIGKAVFVTEENRQQYKELTGFDNYDDYIVLGNTLESNRSVSREDIIKKAKQKSEKNDGVFRGIYLVRISRDRIEDLENLLGFARFLKENGINDIVIDIYGDGDYSDEFLLKIREEKLDRYINCCGKTNNIKKEFEKHDAVVDFTLNHSFGMPYIEAVLNGKMVFCADNTGSREVLKGIDGCIYHSYDDLLQKIRSFPNITYKQLLDNYDKVSSVYSREVLAKNFIDFIDKK